MCKSCFGLQEREEKDERAHHLPPCSSWLDPRVSPVAPPCAVINVQKWREVNTHLHLTHIFEVCISDRISCHRAATAVQPQSAGAGGVSYVFYVELFPVCSPNSEMDSRVSADRSQRQWFKGQNQQQESLLVKKRLTDTSWWETVFVESSESSLSCLHLTVLE